MDTRRPENTPLQIAIVVLAGLFPALPGEQGESRPPELDRFWNVIRDGRSVAREVPEGRWLLDPDDVFDPEVGAPDKAYSKRGCFLDHLPSDSDLADLPLDPDFLTTADPLYRLTLHVGRQAFSDARLEDVDRSRIGVILGNLALPTEKSSALAHELLGSAFEEHVLRTLDCSNLLPPAPGSPFKSHPLNRCVTGLPASLLAYALGLGAGAYTLDAACASSLYALKLAANALLSGRADAMLAGGVSRPDCLYTQMGFSQLRALSATGVCSPFDARGNGLVVGEGAGIFVLKRLGDALRAGDRIYAVLQGAGLSNDIGGSLLAPISDGQVRAMRPAYEQAGWKPDDVDLIECHATGTPVGDAVEFKSLLTLWEGSGLTVSQSVTRRDPERKCVIGSVKSNVGHLLTAAGAAALMKVILALQHETLPPTANFIASAPSLGMENSPFRVLNQSEPWERRTPGTPRRAAVSAFGFGGINAHLLLEEWVNKASETSSIENDISDISSSEAKTHSPEKPVASVSGQSSFPPPEPIAVVGLGAAFGKWPTLRAFQERGLGGGDPIETSTSRGWRGLEKTPWFRRQGLNRDNFRGYFLDEVEIPLDQFRIPPKELENMLPQQLLMMQVAAEAVEDAKLQEYDRFKTGVFIGLGLDPNTTNFTLRWNLLPKAREWARLAGLNLDEAELEGWVRELRDACSPPLTANRTMGALGGVVASRIAREFRFGGSSFTLSSEETSGLQALEAAFWALQERSLDVAVIGAIDMVGDLRTLAGAGLHASYSPNGKACPFDQQADGRVAGEGACAVVVKRYSDAIRDGDRIYAVVKGMGISGGGSPFNATPVSSIYRQSLTRAFDSAGVDPKHLRYFETHAPGAPEDDRAEAQNLLDFMSQTERTEPCLLSSVKADIGDTGHAAGLASLVRACLALYHEILPPCRHLDTPDPAIDTNRQAIRFPRRPQYWLRNRAEDPRLAGVGAVGLGGDSIHVILQGADRTRDPLLQKDKLQPLGARCEALFVIAANTVSALTAGFNRLRAHVTRFPRANMEQLARLWWRENRDETSRHLAVSFIARSVEELLEQLTLTEQTLARDPEKRLGGGGSRPGDSPLSASPAARDRVFFSPDPFAYQGGEIGFIFPGSGNHFLGMGRDLALEWPEVYRNQDQQNEYLRDQFQPDFFWTREVPSEIEENHKAFIFGQVALGTAVTDLIQSFGIRPRAVIGYSLGESAGLFSLRAWTDRDLMLQRMNASTLFTTDLAGRCDAVRRAWKLPASKTVDWVLGVIDRPAKVVRASLQDHKKVYRLIVNTLHECVIGGDRKAVDRLVKKLDCEFFPLQGVTTVHCEVAKEVEQPYRELHLFDTTAPRDIRFYSGAWGTSYNVSRESAADAILAQALYGIDYPKVINAAYEDGVRMFLEMGPGASCSRMIGEILTDRPHWARSACAPGQDSVSLILRMLGHLIAERVPVDLSVLYGQETEVVGHADLQSGTDRPSLRITVGVEEPYRIPSPPERKPPKSQQVPSPAPVQTFSQGIRPEEPIRQEFSRPAVPEWQPEVAPVPLVSPLPQTVWEGPPPAPTGNVTALAGMVPGAGQLMEQIRQTETAKLQAHESFLNLTQSLTGTLSSLLSLQMSLAQAAVGLPVAPGPTAGFASPSTVPDFRPEIGLAPLPFQTPVPQPAGVQPFLNRAQCLEFAIGSIARVLGPQFAEVDTYPTRVRLPDDPLMLVDRVVLVEGEAAYLSDPEKPCSGAHGRVVTEHDVRPGAWYLDAGRMPTCVTVEAGQADLFLSGYLGADFRSKGRAVYRLLDATITFHDSLPRAGETIRYDIRILRFFRQGTTHLFLFEYDATVGGRPLLTMRNGCAGFFTNEELANGQGIVLTAEARKRVPGRRPADWEAFVPMAVESYNDAQLDALRVGDLAGCFGPAFAGLGLRNPLVIPGGNEPPRASRPPMERGSLKLVDRVLLLDPEGGRYGMGFIRAEADIHPDDWFLTCHFSDDNVMPGTLMYECCFHTLRIFLLRMGWVGEADAVACEPTPGQASQLICRGQVLSHTRKVTYEVLVKELGYGAPDGTSDGQTPYALADVYMYGDGKRIVDIRNMSVRMTGLTREGLRRLWRRKREDRKATAFTGETPVPLQPHMGGTPVSPPYNFESILAFSNGRPSDAYGERYRVFDEDRRIARLPRPPYQFLDRVVETVGDPWVLKAGVAARAEYDLPPEAWYWFTDELAEGATRETNPTMPFAVLLEVALQPCGWLAAYAGSALTSATDLKFRNLGGQAIQVAPITPATKALTIVAQMKKVASTGGMIIQEFDFEVHRLDGFSRSTPLAQWFDPALNPVAPESSPSPETLLYKGTTQFGFFSKEALANQVGIRGATPYQPSEAERARGLTFDYPTGFPFPSEEGIGGLCSIHLTARHLAALQPDQRANLRFLDRIDLFVPDGGPKGLGFIRGSKPVDRAGWFFNAHFYQDPVIPGSIGLETFQQLLKVVAVHRWGGGDGENPVSHTLPPTARFESMAQGETQQWAYRGQVVPANQSVTVEAVVTELDDTRKMVRANGYLMADGKVIYQMDDFTLRLIL